jgi:bacterioferritin-associated ferredoxin
MIVCICNNINSATIKTSIEQGATSVDAVKEATGAASCCGKCQFKVNRLVQDHVPEQLFAKQARQH